MSLSANQLRIVKSLVHGFTNRDKLEYWRSQYPRADATIDLMIEKGLIIPLDGDRIAVTRKGLLAYHEAQRKVALYRPYYR